MLPAPIPLDENERLASLRRMLLLSTPDEEAFERVTRVAQQLFKVPITLFSLVDAERQWFKSCIGLPVRETPRDISFCGHAIMSDELFVIEDAPHDSRFTDNPLVTGEPGVVFYAGRPIKNAEGFRIGTLCVIDRQPRVFSQEERRALDDLGCWLEQILLTRDLGQAETQMLADLDDARRTGMLDPMLNIWHHGAILEMLEHESERAFRSQAALSVFMIDIDFFKGINDHYGHLAGDAVLVDFAKRLRSVTRSYDSLGRYGGDEFMVVLPGTDAATANLVAERLLRAVVLSPVVVGEVLLDFTISVGIATADYVSFTPEPAALLELADAALLQAKREGRARAVAHKVGHA